MIVAFTIMPSITRSIDLSRGLKIPIRVTNGLTSARTNAIFSLTSLECQISTKLIKRMHLTPLGHYTRPTVYTDQQECSDISYHVELSLIKGGLGHPITSQPLRRLKVVATKIDLDVGIVLGLHVIHQGIFTINNQSFSFSF